MVVAAKSRSCCGIPWSLVKPWHISLSTELYYFEVYGYSVWESLQLCCWPKPKNQKEWITHQNSKEHTKSLRERVGREMGKAKRWRLRLETGKVWTGNVWNWKPESEKSEERKKKEDQKKKVKEEESRRGKSGRVEEGIRRKKRGKGKSRKKKGEEETERKNKDENTTRRPGKEKKKKKRKDYSIQVCVG